MALMLGVIGAHLTVLGISINEQDGGTLFAMAWVTLFAGAAVSWLRRGDFPYVTHQGDPG